jgi:hypothetical protein
MPLTFAVSNKWTMAGSGEMLASPSAIDLYQIAFRQFQSAIQEFSILTANYTAEHVNTSGMVIKTVTNSGTNQFQDDAYHLLRSNHLDARRLGLRSHNQRNSFGKANEVPMAAALYAIHRSILDATFYQNSGAVYYATLRSSAD